jgi:hypothetical protein
MPRQRKTRDEYQIHVDYGQGFEEVCAEDTYPDAKQRLREYRENMPQYPAKIVKRRIRITESLE